MDAKITVAVDLDEVLGGFVDALAVWHNLNYGTGTHYPNDTSLGRSVLTDTLHASRVLSCHPTPPSTALALSDFHSYHFSDVWGGSAADTMTKMHAFFESRQFAGIAPLSDAAATLRRHAGVYRFVVVTSRQHALETTTRAWLNTHYPGIFADVVFGNHYGVAGVGSSSSSSSNVKRTKAAMCTAVGASILIDDSPAYAVEAAGAVDVVLLFGRYAWNAAARETGEVAVGAAASVLERTLHDGSGVVNGVSPTATTGAAATAVQLCGAGGEKAAHTPTTDSVAASSATTTEAASSTLCAGGPASGSTADGSSSPPSTSTAATAAAIAAPSDADPNRAWLAFNAAVPLPANVVRAVNWRHVGSLLQRMSAGMVAPSPATGTSPSPPQPRPAAAVVAARNGGAGDSGGGAASHTAGVSPSFLGATPASLEQERKGPSPSNVAVVSSAPLVGRPDDGGIAAAATTTTLVVPDDGVAADTFAFSFGFVSSHTPPAATAAVTGSDATAADATPLLSRSGADAEPAAPVSLATAGLFESAAATTAASPAGSTSMRPLESPIEGATPTPSPYSSATATAGSTVVPATAAAPSSAPQPPIIVCGSGSSTSGDSGGHGDAEAGGRVVIDVGSGGRAAGHRVSLPRRDAVVITRELAATHSSSSFSSRHHHHRAEAAAAGLSSYRPSPSHAPSTSSSALPSNPHACEAVRRAWEVQPAIAITGVGGDTAAVVGAAAALAASGEGVIVATRTGADAAPRGSHRRPRITITLQRTAKFLDGRFPSFFTPAGGAASTAPVSGGGSGGWGRGGAAVAVSGGETGATGRSGGGQSRGEESGASSSAGSSSSSLTNSTPLLPPTDSPAEATAASAGTPAATTSESSTTSSAPAGSPPRPSSRQPQPHPGPPRAAGGVSTFTMHAVPHPGMRRNSATSGGDGGGGGEGGGGESVSALTAAEVSAAAAAGGVVGVTVAKSASASTTAV